ncbi:hypothetical protein TELCIR_18263 [Teladorsagia circumcincta]|uniref:Uncharacterized protein n=1 Tax=Teladorsagia circumcincta TaxID=45464 RepID=A0A2G9TQN0_TELCI|nr:hypothetical protein TELCIR_18263 [Teladorsagia circumcincta]
MAFPWSVGNGTSSEEPLENEDSSESDSEMSNDGDSSSSELSDTCLNKTKVNNSINVISNINNNKLAMNGLPKLELNVTEPALPMSARLLRTSLAPGMTGNRIPAGNAVARYRGPSNLIAYQGKVPSAPTLAVRKKRKNLLAKLHLREVSQIIIDLV